MFTNNITVAELKILLSIFPSQQVLSYITELPLYLADKNEKRQAAFQLMLKSYQATFDGQRRMIRQSELDNIVAEFLKTANGANSVKS